MTFRNTPATIIRKKKEDEMILKKLKTLLGAESTMQARAKIVKVLQSEEKRLGELVAERVTEDRALIEAETAVTLGEQVDATAARRKADEARDAINRQASKLVGLRGRLVVQAAELESQRVAVKSALPSHMESIKGNFSAEWAEGIAAFGALLGKRTAIEGLVGRLNLSEPRPIPYELPTDTAAPWGTIDAIRGAR